MRTKRLIIWITVLSISLCITFLTSCEKESSEGLVSSPAKMWVEPSDANGVPAQIDVFENSVQEEDFSSDSADTCVYQLYLPGKAKMDKCFLSWDGGATVFVDGASYESGSCPVSPFLNKETTFIFKDGGTTLESRKFITYQGSNNKGVQSVFIEIDESGDNPTIAQMDSDSNHEVACTGRININGTWHDMPKINGRGNVTWGLSEDKKPYNITIQTLDKGDKIHFPGIESEKTKKWSFLSELTDHSLLSNRSGYYLGEKLGIGQSTTSADVWMNGEYQGCYTVTPKTDSFIPDDGFMIEQDNYLEDGNDPDPQFKLAGLAEAPYWGDSGYNRITFKKIGDDLLTKDGVTDESYANQNAVAEKTLLPWIQEAWDAIRSDDGYNPTTHKHYTDYIDIESFAKMYLLHDYVKSIDFYSGSILFHRDGSSDEDKLIAGPIWDLDNAMGANCQNSDIGMADDRVHGDRRRGDGEFIALVGDAKTSIYKTLGKHDDFMKEVYRQYNENSSAFDNLPKNVKRMRNEIEDSAKMNHYKVNDITGTYANTHNYDSPQSFGSGEYLQEYLATNDSRTDWANYAANLETYVKTRSAWFHNTYTDEN